ncbi:MAG: CRISPR-associated CARF protein Csa3, partial [Halobacteriota archaeon]
RTNQNPEGEIMVNVMIATVGFESEPLIIGIQTFNIKRMILIREANPPSEVKKVENLMASTFGSVIDIITKEVPNWYDILGLVDLVTYLIKSEHDNGNTVYVNITGGRKTASIGALLGVFKMVDEVKEVFYVTEEEHRILPLPKISWALQRTKYNLLKLIDEGVSDVDALKDELEISRVMTYTHLRDLRDQALIVESPSGYELTLAGKLLLI